MKVMMIGGVAEEIMNDLAAGAMTRHPPAKPVEFEDEFVQGLTD